MTNQEVFDKVATFLLAQGRASAFLDEDNYMKCRYRYQDGDKTLMCAAGCLIPDEEYDEKFEGAAVSDMRVQKLLIKLGYDTHFVGSLQSAHDAAAAAEDYSSAWKAAISYRLRKVAENYGLYSTVLDV